MQIQEMPKVKVVARVKALVDPDSGYYIDEKGNELDKCPVEILDKIKEITNADECGACP